MTNNQLQQLIQRIEKLEDEKSTLMLDIKEVYSEAKSMGFDPKIIKKVVAIRAKDALLVALRLKGTCGEGGLLPRNAAAKA